MTFTTQETATILAALRYWQSEAITGGGLTETGTIVRPTACNQFVHFEEDEPLNKQEIDDLCERINTDPETPTIRGWIEEGDLRLYELPAGTRLIIDNYDDVNMSNHPGAKIKTLRKPPIPDKDGFYCVGREKVFRRMVYEGE